MGFFYLFILNLISLQITASGFSPQTQDFKKGKDFCWRIGILGCSRVSKSRDLVTFIMSLAMKWQALGMLQGFLSGVLQVLPRASASNLFFSISWKVRYSTAATRPGWFGHLSWVGCSLCSGLEPAYVAVRCCTTSKGKMCSVDMCTGRGWIWHFCTSALGLGQLRLIRIHRTRHFGS